MGKNESTAPYKVLYLNPVSAISGAEMSLLMLLQKLSRRQFEPLVVLPERGLLHERVQALGIELKFESLHKINVRNPVPYLKTVWNLARTINDCKIDLVHCNMDICNQYGVIAARLAGVPVVTHTRNILGQRAFRRMFLGWADVLIANSKAVADSYAQYISRNRRVEIIYNGVDIAEFNPNGRHNSRSRFKANDDEFVIGQIARIDPSKGQDILIKALAKIVQTHPNVRALVVGDTVIDDSQWYLNELGRLVQDFGLGDRVIFTGFLDDIVSVYRALDLLVVASQAEPFGRTLIEAMAMEKPVVATNRGGPCEIVMEGKTGLLVPYGDAEALGRAILRLMENPQFAMELGANGRQRAEEQFSIEQNVWETEQVYVSLLSGRGAGHP